VQHLQLALRDRSKIHKLRSRFAFKQGLRLHAFEGSDHGKIL
jgi:hypothetical protein